MELEAWLRSTDGRRNGAAFVAGTRLSATLRDELDSLEHPEGAAPQEDPSAGLTDEQLIAALVAAIAEIPEAALDRVESAVTHRRIGKPGRRS